MGVFIKANSNKIAYGIKDLVIDLDSDLKKLDVKALSAGTTVFSIESSKHFMLNTKKEWKEIDPLGSGAFTSATIDLDGGFIDE